MSTTATGLPAFAPLTDAATVPPLAARLLLLASFAWTAIVVRAPAVPTGTLVASVVAAVAAPGVNVIGDAAVVSAPLENVIVVGPPTVPVSLRLVNVAVPLDAVADSVPPSVPGPAVTAAVTLAPDVVRLPLASSTRTTGCVVKFAPLTAPAGAVRTLSCEGAPGVNVIEEVAFAIPELVNVIAVAPPTAPVSTRLVNVATPPTAATVVVPLRTPGPAVTDASTDAVDVVTRLLLASRTCTTGCVENVAPLAAPAGAVATVSTEPVPGATTELYGLPPIATPPSVMAMLSVPAIVGV